jgi:hypothetical protein
VLEEKTQKLEEENKSLLERWMAKIKNEAETLNDANEFLARVMGMRMSSPNEEQVSTEEKQSSE